jgi:hypothetical protein
VVAPDYAAPLVGWRGWLALSVEDELRLCSPIYSTVWLPREATSAVCQLRERPLGLPVLRNHAAPDEGCRCGLYASASPQTAASFISAPFLSGRDPDLRQRVFGRVSLWGRVVVYERGWRAELAYPALLYVPILTGGIDRHHPTGEAPSLPAEKVTEALLAYGVPVEVVAGETLREVAVQLEGR